MILMSDTGDKNVTNNFVCGIVVPGDQLGRQLGFPTANLQLPNSQGKLPATGVFAVTARFDGQPFYGICNVGFRPTFHGKRFTIEVHILNFSGDLYGKEMQVTFVKKLRNEQKFSNLEELKKQISIDRENAVRLFSGGY